MVADIADEHELSTGRRQEGIFFGALSFAVKSSSGFGHLVAGLSLDAIGFPRQVRVEEVPEDQRRMLAWIFCGFLLVLGTVSVATARRYALTRERHAEIVRELERRRSERAAPA
jgi:Na+/melibiose symporter-like transporter